MEYTYNDILQNKNKEKEFICTSTGAMVKNIDDSLYLAQEVKYLMDEKKDNSNIIHLERTNDKIKWKKVSEISFWVNAKYKLLVHAL